MIRAYSIKRFEVPQHWDVQAILDMQGTLQKPDPNKPGLHIPIRIRLEPPVEVMVPGPEREEEAPKRPYPKKYHFEEDTMSLARDVSG